MPDLQSFPEPPVDPDFSDRAVFGCALTHSGRHTAWIRLSGELDLTSAAEVERCLSQALGGARRVVVDLRQLSFMDSTGVHLIVNAHDRALRTERRLVLVRGSVQITRLLDLTGLSDRLEIVDLGPVAARRQVAALAPVQADAV